ncbi:MAG: hypothetical protein J5701_06255 [Bacteroidales bacterium]|nr:hypothetical protein [Bacteroidales bacterium]
MKRLSFFQLFSLIASGIVVIAFFIVSYCGFFWSDDWYPMSYQVSSLKDIFPIAGNLYMTWGGRYFGYFVSFLFICLLKNKLWFDIFNTLFFCTLIVISGCLIADKKSEISKTLLPFALLFWFLCPLPSESLFWVSGATNHFWTSTLVFLFLYIFLQYKDKNFSPWKKTGLFFISLFSAQSEIPCMSIGGALFVYYLFNLKKIKNNTIPLILGFAIGTLLLLLAPGNFNRAETHPYYLAFFDHLIDIFHHPIQEIRKYKALWLLVGTWLIFLWKNKNMAVEWVRNNVFLLLILLWSIFLFSFIFHLNDIRASFFIETMSIILFIKLAKHWFLQASCYTPYKWASLIFFILFAVDASFAIAETKKASQTNDRILQEIAAANGIVAVDLPQPEHRMTPTVSFPNWTWEGLAHKLGLDSVKIYPHYCQEKYWQSLPVSESETSVFIDEYRRYQTPVIIRCPEEKNENLICEIQAKEKKWFYLFKERLHCPHEDILLKIPLQQPATNCNGYSYYVVVFDHDKTPFFNIKNVNVTDNR